MKPAIQPFGDGVVTLRPMEEKDLCGILEWRNRDAARVWFKNSDMISLPNHQAWFARYQTTDDDFFFMVLYCTQLQAVDKFRPAKSRFELFVSGRVRAQRPRG
jgi:hypothetical protein